MQKHIVVLSSMFFVGIVIFLINILFSKDQTAKVIWFLLSFGLISFAIYFIVLVVRNKKNKEMFFKYN